MSSLLQHFHKEQFIAGVTGGAVSTLVLHPFDLVKIRFQVNESGKHRQVTDRPKYNGLFDAFRSIWRQEGFRGLYRGVFPNVLGSGSSWGIYFFIYSALKQKHVSGDLSKPLAPHHHIMNATGAGAVTLLLTNPIWVIKTRLCLQYGTNFSTSDIKQYSGTWDAFMKIAKNEGIRGLYKGLGPGLWGVSHGAIQFMVYEELKTYYNQYREFSTSRKFTTVEYLCFAAISKTIAVMVTYPYQVFRSRLQDQHRNYSNVREIFVQIMRREGVTGFYKGITPYLMTVVPSIALIFLVYEKLANEQQVALSAKKLTDSTAVARLKTAD